MIINWNIFHEINKYILPINLQCYNMFIFPEYKSIIYKNTSINKLKSGIIS